jgi:hypothetical protein
MFVASVLLPETFLDNGMNQLAGSERILVFRAKAIWSGSEGSIESPGPAVMSVHLETELWGPTTGRGEKTLPAPKSLREAHRYNWTLVPGKAVYCGRRGTGGPPLWVSSSNKQPRRIVKSTCTELGPVLGPPSSGQCRFSGS